MSAIKPSKEIKRLRSEKRTLLAALKRLEAAAMLVIESWEKGDLASAARGLCEAQIEARIAINKAKGGTK